MKNSLLDGVKTYWSLIAAAVAVVVFAVTLSGRVSTLEMSVNLLRIQVEKTCERMEGMAKDMTEIKVSMAKLEGAGRQAVPVASSSAAMALKSPAKALVDNLVGGF